MRNKPLKGLMRKPGAPKDKSIIDAGVKHTGKKVLKQGLKTIGARGLSRAITPIAAVLGAKDVFDGYGRLAKTKHGKQIIKDARMMPGKM